MPGHSPPPHSGVGRNGSQLRQNRGRSLAMRLLAASRTQGSLAISVAPARINSHMSIPLGRDQDRPRLRRSNPTRQSGRPMSETSDAAVTIDLNNLVGLDTREGMNALTDFGDAAVLLPLSIVILLWMVIHHGHRISVSWVIAVSLCVGATTLLKIYLYACPPQPNLVRPEWSYQPQRPDLRGDSARDRR